MTEDYELEAEARRLARNLLKDEIKARGEKASHILAADITKAAIKLLEQKPEIYDIAKAHIAERKALAKRIVSR